MEKKVCVVTGGSSGIGFAVVKKMISKNYEVINLDIQNPHDTDTFSASYYHVDLTSYQNLTKIITEILEKTKKIDFLFLNAGVHYSGNIEQTDLEIIDKIIDINLKGALFTLKAILPYMRKQNFGKIVINSSDQALVGKANSTVYGCTKAAIAQLAKSVAIDYAQYNILCNAICPGTIDTPLYRKAIQKYCEKSNCEESQVHKAEAAQQLVNRIGKPEEVANLVAFLFSDESNFITGSLIPIDGGYTAV